MIGQRMFHRFPCVDSSVSIIWIEAKVTQVFSCTPQLCPNLVPGHIRELTPDQSCDACHVGSRHRSATCLCISIVPPSGVDTDAWRCNLNPLSKIGEDS